MIKRLLINASCKVILLFSLSCTSGQQKKEQVFINSKVYPEVHCTSDTSLTYALFLPPQYEKEKSCPVFILFDPHGDGMLPVNLFSTEAAKSGFILAGSNNSKNGMDYPQTTGFYRNMLADLKNRFNIEKKAIYVGGFSGGSRVAASIAFGEGGVAGVVGCGAGLNNSNSKPTSKFSYLGVVGSEDFNYSELLQLDEILDYAGYQHHLLVFEGIHQWPVKDVIPDIFTWLRFDEMRQKVIPANRAEINLFIENNDKIATSWSAQGNFLQQQQTYIKMVHYLQELTDIVPLQSEIKRLEGEKKVISAKRDQKKIVELEKELQNRYSTELQLQNIEWWTKEAKKLHILTKKPLNPEINQVYKRLLGYLSLDCYMISSNELKKGNLKVAERFIEIYRLVDPTNAEHRYLAAKVAAKNNNSDSVFVALNQAFELGFNNIQRLQSDPDFKPYLSDQRFKKLISGQ